VEQCKGVTRDISTPTLYGFKKDGLVKYNLNTKKMIKVDVPMANYMNFNSDRSSWVCYCIHKVLILSADNELVEGNCFLYNDEDVSMTKTSPLNVPRHSVGLVAYK